MQIGKTIRKTRKERKMTLLELSKKSGVALATLSRMENNRMTGTLKSHMRICDALEMSLPELYQDLSSSKRPLDVRTGQGRTTGVFMHDKKSSTEMLASKSISKKMMPMLITINAGGSTPKEETKRGIDKFIYVLDGKVEARIGDENYNLGRNDTLYFESSIPHCFKNASASESRLLCVTCPPAL